MYRVFKKAENERVEIGDVVQVLEDNTICQLPLVEKGINFKDPITNDYPKGCGTLGKIDNNKVITLVNNTIYVSKYENNEFIELTSFQLGGTESSNINSKIINITNNKSIIVYNLMTNIYCYLLHIDESNSICNLSDNLIVTTNTGFSRFDATVLSDNKIVITYLENIKGDMYERSPSYVVINIENNELKIIHSPLVLKKKTNAYWNPFVTKISESEFLGSYIIEDNKGFRTARVINTVYSINSSGTIVEHETFEYQGHYNSIYTAVKPVYLEDNKIMTVEFTTNWDASLIIREIKQELTSGVYTYNSLATLKVPFDFSSSHNMDYLKINMDGSRDYIIFNSAIVNVNSSNNVLALVDRFAQFKPKKLLSHEYLITPTINLDNNLMLTLNDDSDFILYKFNEYEGNFLGVVKGRYGDDYTVTISGLIEDVSGIKFTLGKNVYCDTKGKIHQDTKDCGVYLGYAVSSNAFILRPALLNMKSIVRKTGAGFKHRGKIYIHGYIPYVDEAIQHNKTYYLDKQGDLTTASKDNTYLGVGIGKGLYVNLGGIN